MREQIKKAMNYLYLKSDMGLIHEVLIHEYRESSPYHVCLQGLSPKMWDEVVKPGLAQFTSITAVDMGHGRKILMAEGYTYKGGPFVEFKFNPDWDTDG